jgi:hypothetical protein
MNYFKSPTMMQVPEYLAGGCACNEYGMVTPANVATLGAMELGRSTYSYDRAIARVKGKINLLKKKRNAVKSKIRKRALSQRIAMLQKRLQKLKAYKKVRIQKKLDKSDAPIAEDEGLILQEALAENGTDPLMQDMDLMIEDQFQIEQEQQGMGFGRIALFTGLAIAGIIGVRMLKPKKKVRSNRLKMGKKANPKRRRVRRVKKR